MWNAFEQLLQCRRRPRELSQILHAPSRVMTHSEQNQSPSGMEFSFGCGGETMVPTVQAMLVFLVFDCLQNMYGRYRVLQAIKIWRQGVMASLMYVCMCVWRYTGHRASTQDGWCQEGRRGTYLAAVGVCSFVTSITQEQERLTVCTVTLLAELWGGGGGEGRRREGRRRGEEYVAFFFHAKF